MSTTVSVQAFTQIRTLKTVTPADPSNPDVTLTSVTNTTPYNAGTTPAATKTAKFTLALSSGAATLDLTAIPDDANGTFDGTGLKVQFLWMQATGTNANKIVASQGASSAYRQDGATNWSEAFAPGQTRMWENDAAADTIGSSHKNIDFAGTLEQTIEIHLVLG